MRSSDQPPPPRCFGAYLALTRAASRPAPLPRRSFFPTLMGATACIVFGLLAIAFRSAVVAIRAVLSITVIVACTFGCAAAVFTQGVLDSDHEKVLSSQYGGIFWLMPLLVRMIQVLPGFCFSASKMVIHCCRHPDSILLLRVCAALVADTQAFAIIVGFGLDYDIFLMTRIEEERRARARLPSVAPSHVTSLTYVYQPGVTGVCAGNFILDRYRGWTDASAIVLGVSRSGPIISWAGIIMAVAFAGARR